MKMLFRAVSTVAVITALIAPRVLAQDATPAPSTPTPAVPAAPTPAPVIVAPAETPAPTKTNAPAKKPVAKKAAAKPAAKKTEPKVEAKSEPVLNPEPGVAKQNNVNVRGQAAINSEVIAHLKKGDAITVLEEVTLKKPKQDEPSRWYRIALPSTIGVWVNASFIDTAANTVKVNRLNMRGGPGENYSILGRLEKGAVIKPIDTKGGWIKIEPPTNSFAFVAAHLVERQPAAAIAAVPKPEPAPAPVIVPPITTTPVPSNPPPTVAEVTPVVPPPATVTPTPAPAETVTPMPATPAPAEVVTSAPIETVRKVVSREGILKGSSSIQAPSYFELRSLDTGKAIDYVFSPSTNLMLKEFKGQRVIVTGEEILDERWQHTPVIVVDELQVVR